MSDKKLFLLMKSQKKNKKKKRKKQKITRTRKAISGRQKLFFMLSAKVQQHDKVDDEKPLI